MAQRFPFERTFDATGASTLDVSTLRGKIDVTAGDPGRIVVAGTVTVRVDWNVPADAEDLAKQVAANPPIQQDAERITLRPPSDPAAQRAVTVSYQVRVPPNTRVTTTSDSGATTVREVSGTVSVRTQSGAIELGKLGADVEVTTGSRAPVQGSVTKRKVAGTVGTGGPLVRANSRSGSIHLKVGS